MGRCAPPAAALFTYCPGGAAAGDGVDDVAPAVPLPAAAAVSACASRSNSSNDESSSSPSCRMADKDGASVALVVPPITASRSASKSISDLAAESKRIGKVGGGGGEVGGWRGKGEGNMRGETRERESESERERERDGERLDVKNKNTRDIQSIDMCFRCRRVKEW